jgi:DNA-binding PadR family transcriptional regulator
MTRQFICKVKHPKNFGIALWIMAELKRGYGIKSITDTKDFGQQQPLLDEDSLKLWLYTLLGSGYIKKVKSLPDRSRYSLTSKGEVELQYHTIFEEHKMFIQSMI